MLVAHLTLVKAFRRMFIWLIKSLAENITWQDKIRDELIKMKRQDLYSDDNLQLEYFRDLNMFLCETMRMYPSELVTRKVTRSFKFKEHEIPMGTLIDVDLKCLHLNPLFWEFPDKFMPERCHVIFSARDFISQINILLKAFTRVRCATNMDA
jgi:cytochrome P450